MKTNSPVCKRCLTTSVGTLTNEAANPARAPPPRAARYCLFSGTFLAICCLTGSYTPMKMADAGMTPAKLPHTPAYRALPPPPFSKELKPPPEMEACRRVLMVSMGYRAARHYLGFRAARSNSNQVKGLRDYARQNTLHLASHHHARITFKADSTEPTCFHSSACGCSSCYVTQSHPPSRNTSD